MSLEQSFCAYMAAFDSTRRDFSEVNHHFHDVYHEDFSIEMNGHIINREELGHIQANHLEIGTKATIIHFKQTSNEVIYKIHIVNEKVDLILHMIALVKDNKILQTRAVYDGYIGSFSKCEIQASTSAYRRRSKYTLISTMGKSRHFRKWKMLLRIFSTITLFI